MSFSTNNMMETFAANMTPKFAVSYLRVSTRGQAERGGGADEGFSIPAQREANKRKALSMGAIVGKEFVDRGASAKSADRPELQKMLEYVKENADRVDYVIIHKVDRLARNRGDDIDIMRTLRECGVQLVSASESIDDTPAGMLLHGIMSSIAEFYSQNLANEVKKGMGEKVKGGGTITRAPLGYLNVHRVDDKGREERTVVLDEERAPLIKLAFEEYATGNWTVNDLAEHLAACGLTTRATPKIPSAPIDRKALYKVLANPYYTGVVTYRGVEHTGNHTALIDQETWQQVQGVLSSHVNGERTREHPHFLKGSLYCHSCGSRIFINYTKSKTGVRYPYFICGGRHNKVTNCKQKAVLIDEVERQVEQIYDRYSFPPAVRAFMENFLADRIKDEQKKCAAELDGLRREKDKLERKRKKLLEAHYNDAIPLDLMKSEQQKIAKQLAAVESQIKAHEHTSATMLNCLSDAMDLIEDCGKTYRLASDHIKRMMNQAIFSKLWIEPDGRVTAEFREPFKTVVEPISTLVAQFNQQKIRGAEALTDFLSVISNRIQKFFGCGWSNDLLVYLPVRYAPIGIYFIISQKPTTFNTLRGFFQYEICLTKRYTLLQRKEKREMYEKWRKLCAMLLIITIAVSLAACGSSTTKGQKDVNSPSASGQQLPQSTNEVEPSAELGETEQEPEIIQETIEDKAKKAMETLEVWDGSIAESFDGGDGSAENPYQISNGEQLAKLSSDTNSGVDFSGTHFVLTSDILLNDISTWNFELSPKENANGGFMGNQWTPIGLNYRFNGLFDGCGHIIFGLYNTGFYSRSGSSSPAGNVGLFGEFRGNLSNINIACGWLSPGCENIGTIAGSADEGYIYDCNIWQVGIEPIIASNIGGICGDFVNNDMCIVANCSTNGTISYSNLATKNFNIGGISGTAGCYDDDGTISNCCNSFDIIVYADITEDYSNGFDLPGINVGGICGSGEIIEGCINTGNIAIEAYDKLSDEAEDIPFVRVGGIAGTCHVSATNCCSSGKITYTGNISIADSGAGAYIGGVSGLLGNTRAYGSFGGLEVVNVTFCYSNTEINTSSPEVYVGGISGSACGEITVTDCYYDDQYAEKGICVTLARREEYYGTSPFTGGPRGSISSKVFTNQIKGVSEVELKNAGTFSGWDFDYIWMLDEGINDGFPIPTSVLEFLNYSNSSK